LGKRGLTVAELLLILIILSILGYISYNEISNLIMNHRLRVSLDRLHSDIIKVRTYSIMKGNPWGIRLEPGKNCYVIFDSKIETKIAGLETDQMEIKIAYTATCKFIQTVMIALRIVRTWLS